MCRAAANRLSEDDERRRIYVLGMGNLGRLFAVSLAKLPNRPPITLVVHRPGLLEQWRSNPGVVLHPPSYLEGQKDTDDDSSRITDFDIEMWSEAPPPSGQESTEISNISNLVISTKAQDALKTADWLRRYLGPESTVAFAQNGMNKLWPPYGAIYNDARHPSTSAERASPQWLACIVTHGVFSIGPFASVHASLADVVLGVVGDDDLAAPGQDSYLVQQIMAASQLNARWAPRHELWVLQLEKLVVNCIINPLTAILRCKNGALFVPGGESAVPEIIDELLEEASSVLRTLVLHEIENGTIFGQDGNSGTDKDALVERLSFKSLRAMVYRVGELVKDNNSSMFQDASAGKKTEVGEMNGWVVEMARYLESVGATDGGKPISVKTNEKMVDLVEKAVPLSKDELNSHFL
ncbi:2-dehydropantoate 2-reductase (Ketopantoate reductase) (KPA reductase) (KPR) [Sporothrix stenoceras]|uniref:2-dehydropantoate 2-reductase (Ketopantoate reductase) (KPA reductase) (KPR) n=1 Tax=Sporothrix stenoceras TaxID=5173 RepID=A0ABR3ZK91_9PEZI